MSSGLAALLDDVAGIAKLAATSLDDVAGAAGKAGSKAAGVVIDDTAVTPRYVVGFTPDRELPIIGKIAFGSLRNKMLFLLPGAMLLSAFAPWAITPLLMLGGAYLCFEGAEKVMEVFMGHGPRGDDSVENGDMALLEKQKVSGAVRTDLILSAEIMAIALADVSDKPLVTQAIVLAVVGLLVTVGVYGVVALIVKMDDIGLHLAARDNRPVALIGRAMVKAMPWLLSILAGVGTAAMIWVGGGILIHGLDHFGLSAIPDALHHGAGAAANMAPAGRGTIEWLVTAIGSGICGLAVGSVIVALVHVAKHRRD